MNVKVGARLRSATSAVEVVVVRSPSSDLELCCGGAPMVARADDASLVEGSPELDDVLAVGKRYATEDAAVEVMVTKGGIGTLTLGDEVLQQKATKKLPASD